ncbi:CBS domain-containing protein [Halobacillus litoralis]|uniref:CBS domain-containing protein n=1 Tax=Halobacillus litoralis TaxID=45668 RepID=UPI001CD5D3B5|nr:CBS domain-containing protein [Halobacillus litoralis]MCA0969398.1 CBS domain-containing protein [Halobacillus litoralis]
MKTVGEIMTKNVSCCNSDSRLSEAASMMKDKNIGALPVLDTQGNVLGMVTDRDLVLRGYAANRPESSAVQDVMSNGPVCCSPNTSLEEASQIMAEKQIRRLPVVENGQIMGIISLGDLSLDQKSDQSAGQALHEISERPELH